jgi:hypothetical protein
MTCSGSRNDGLGSRRINMTYGKPSFLGPHLQKRRNWVRFQPLPYVQVSDNH